MSAKVESIEYDPNRSCFIALVAYKDGQKRYILAPKDLKKGDKVKIVRGHLKKKKGKKKKVNLKGNYFNIKG